jgi:lysophospholipase L1-like esterase
MDTGNGLKMLTEWLGNTQWALIHFNWGLWDLCYRLPEANGTGKLDKINGTLTTTLEQYEKNLNELVTILKRTGAILIWAQTTVVPEGEPGRFAGDEKKYNEVATKVMRKNGVTVNKLYSLTKSFRSDSFVANGNVHYTEDGYRKIAEQVVNTIRTALKGEQSPAFDALRVAPEK